MENRRVAAATVYNRVRFNDFYGGARRSSAGPSRDADNAASRFPLSACKFQRSFYLGSPRETSVPVRSATEPATKPETEQSPLGFVGRRLIPTAPLHTVVHQRIRATHKQRLRGVFQELCLR